LLYEIPIDKEFCSIGHPPIYIYIIDAVKGSITTKSSLTPTKPRTIPAPRIIGPKTPRVTSSGRGGTNQLSELLKT